MLLPPGAILLSFLKKDQDYLLGRTILRIEVNLWNSLPDFIISAPTVATFKLCLDNFWKQSRYGHLQRPVAYSLAI